MTARPTPYAGVATRALALDVAIAHVIVFAGGAVLALVASLVGDLRLDTLGRVLAAGGWVTVVVSTSCCSGQAPARRPACGSWACA